MEEIIEGEWIEGSGGGGSTSTQPPPPVEYPNTLRSNSRAKILELLAFGPIVGPVNGLQSIFLDGTPLQNPDGSMNFEGVKVQFRAGYPDQDVIEGFRAVESFRDVSTEVTKALPIVRTINNPLADAAIVVIRIPALVKVTDTGDRNPTKVEFKIDYRVDGGPWTSSYYAEIKGKHTAPYERSYRIGWGGQHGQVDIRVTRVTADSETDQLHNATHWMSINEIMDRKLSYPDMALMAIEVNAAEFGNVLPARTYDMMLSIIRVPSNYDPITRTYTGIWDGTFKMEWSDNPAWAFYDLATHPVIGANIQGVDKWALYDIGRYCDELIPDGKGGMEARFSINTLFASEEDAISALSTLASVFRGMVYWGSDSAVPVADMPKDTTKVVTPANVIDGKFTYTGTSLQERHSVVVVMYNDPENGYESTPVVYEDSESVALFGWRETRVTAVGCTSRGQAMRLAKWILDSERNETETVTYTATIDHADLRPGDIIQIVDPIRSCARIGGRIMDAISLNEVVLDRYPSELTSGTWYLSVVLPDMTIARRRITLVDNSTVRLATQLPMLPDKGTVWIITSDIVEPPEYRVISVTESGNNYEVMATEWDRSKYDRVELGIQMPTKPPSLIPTGPLAPPKSLSAVVEKYVAGGTEHQRLHLSAEPSSDSRVAEYIFEAWGPEESDWRTVYAGPSMSCEIDNASPGEWRLRVCTSSGLGTRSRWITIVFQASHLLLPEPPTSVEVVATSFTISLFPRGNPPGSQYEFWRSGVALQTSMVESNAVMCGLGTYHVDTGLKPDTTYYYYVRGVNVYGKSVWYPVQGTTTRDFDEIIEALDEDIRKPGGLFDQMVNGLSTEFEEARLLAEEAMGISRDSARIVQEVETGFTDVLVSDGEQNVRINAIKAVSEGFSALVATEEVTRISEDEALSERIDEVTSTAGGNSASILDYVNSLANLEMTTAYRLNSLESSFNNMETTLNSRITNEELTRTTLVEALASRVNVVEASLGDNLSARVQTVENALVDATQSIAMQITDLESEMEGQYAHVQQTYSTRAYADGAVARAVTTVTVNGRKAVLGISVDNEVAEIGAIADRFYIYNPYSGGYTLAFAVADGVTVIRDALIRDASITMAKISESLQSDNYVPGSQGWRLTKGGVFEINGQSPGEGQLIQTNQTITVYDEVGNLRVQLGKLG